MDSMETKNQHSVTVGGKKIQLRSSHDEVFINALAEQVNSCIDRVRASSKTEASTQHFLILTCLTLAEEIQLLKAQVQSRLDGIEKIASDMESRL